MLMTPTATTTTTTQSLIPIHIPSTDRRPRNTRIALSPLSLHFVNVTAVWVFDGNLNVETLKDAIGYTVGRWRVLSGRYENIRDDENGKRSLNRIVLVDLPIPFHHKVEKIHPSSFALNPSFPLPSPAVVQSEQSIGEYTISFPCASPSALSSSSSTSSGKDEEKNEEKVNDMGRKWKEEEALLGFKVTNLLKEEDGKVEKMVLGMTWSHLIMDAYAATQFLDQLSHIYNHILSSSLIDIDSLNLAVFSDAPLIMESAIEDTSISSSAEKFRCLQNTCLPPEQIQELYGRWAEINKGAVPMTVTFTESDVQELRRNLQQEIDSVELGGVGKEEEKASGSGREGVRISRQDALTARFVDLVKMGGERGGDGEEEVEKVVNWVSFRSFHPNSTSNSSNLVDEYPLSHRIGNVFSLSPVQIPPGSSRSTTARLIRENIMNLKTDEGAFVRWLTVGMNAMRDAVESGGEIYVMPDPGIPPPPPSPPTLVPMKHPTSRATMPKNSSKGKDICVNSNLGMKWSWDGMFGFKREQVAFHIWFGAVRFLRVFQPNPKSLKVRENGPGAEISFCAPAAQVEKYRGVLKIMK